MPAGVTDPVSANNSQFVNTTGTTCLNADIAVTKSGVSSLSYGAPNSYTVTVSNLGPDAAGGVTILDSVTGNGSNVSLSTQSVGCSATGGAACPATIATPATTLNGTLFNPTIPTLPSGGSVIFTYTFTPATPTNCAITSISVTNTASLQTLPVSTVDSVTTNNSQAVATTGGGATCTTTDIQVTKSGVASLVYGSANSYTITVTNLGTGAANGTSILDSITGNGSNVPIGTKSVGCSAAGGAACPGAIATPATTLNGIQFNPTIPTLPSGGSVVFTYNFTPTRPSSCAVTSISVTNTASWQSLPIGITDTNNTNDSQSVATSGGGAICTATDIQVTKSGVTSLVYGTPNSYTITVTNLGPGAANGTRILDAITGNGTNVPISAKSVGCSAAGGAACPAAAIATPAITLNGTQFNPTIPTLPSGGSVVFTYNFTPTRPTNCAISSIAITNTASLQTLPAGVTDTNNTNDSQAVATTGTTCNATDLQVTKTGAATLVYGAVNSYTITVTNLGPAAANGATILDSIAGNGANVSISSQSVGCTASGGAACPAAAIATPATTLNGTLFNPTIPTLPSGGSVVFTYNFTPATPTICTVTSIAITNTASLQTMPVGITDTNNANDSQAVPTTGGGAACVTTDVGVTKTGPAILTFNSPNVYTLTYTNNGPGTATNLTINDAWSTGTAFVQHGGYTINCVASGGATCPTLNVNNAATTLTGNVLNNTTVPTLPSGGVLTLTLTFTPLRCLTGATAAISLNNRARVTIPTTMIDSVAGNNTGNRAVSCGCADLAITKAVSATSVSPGDAMTFTIDASNTGPAAVANAVVTDALPGGFIVSGTPSCSVVTGAAVCGTVSVSSGTLSSTITSLPVGSSVRFTITGNAISYSSSWTNTATITNPIGEINPSTNTSQVSYQIVGGDPTITKFAASPTAIPGGTMDYTLVVTNPSGSPIITGLSLTDTLPGGFSYASTGPISLGGGATQTSVSNPSSGSTTPTWGTFDVPAGGSIVLTFTSNISPTQPCGVTYNNSANINYTVSGSPDSRTYNGSLSGLTADNVTIPCRATLTKALTATTLYATENTKLTMTLTNGSGNPVQSNLQFTDSLPSGWRIATPNGLINNCGGTVTATAGGTSLQLASGTMFAGQAFCTIEVDITPATGSTNASCATNPAAWTNSASNITATNNSVINGVGNVCLIAPAPPTLTKAFSPATISAGGQTTLTLTFTNSVGTPAQFGVNFTDTLPTGLQIATTPNIGGTCPSATAVTTTSGSTITVTGATMTAGLTGCTVTVDVTNVSGQSNASCATNPAAFTNGVTSISATNHLTNGVTNQCVIVTPPPPVIDLLKSVLPTGVQPPETDLTYTIQFTNSGGVAAQILVLTDPVPLNTDFKPGSVTINLGTTGLSMVTEYSNDYSATSPGSATWTYTPTSGGGGAETGYDRNVKAIRWRVTAGNLSQTSPNNVGEVGFIVKIR